MEGITAMMPNVAVRELMDRTLDNLRFIERHETASDAWEITQLINSFAGAFAHPWELWKEEFNVLKFDSEESHEWPRIKSDNDFDYQPTSVGDQIRLVRNAFAHGNIRLINDGHDRIGAIQIWNVKEGHTTWSTTIDKDTLRQFLETFVHLSHGFRFDENREPPLHITQRQNQPRKCKKCHRPFEE
jgi:hypothetical protein